MALDFKGLFLRIAKIWKPKVKEILCKHAGEHTVDDWGDDNEVLSLCCNPALCYA